MALARFRADPAKVRVGVRPLGRRWQATVAKREGEPHEVSRVRATARGAVFAALDAADASDMPGIDLGMGWAYDHPFGVDL